jgi:hypothetical protein
MREILGWICLGVGAACSLLTLLMEAKSVSHSDAFGDKSFFEREDKIADKTSRKRGFKAVVFIGLGFFVLGMYLVGMFGK